MFDKSQRHALGVILCEHGNFGIIFEKRSHDCVLQLGRENSRFDVRRQRRNRRIEWITGGAILVHGEIAPDAAELCNASCRAEFMRSGTFRIA